MSRGLYIRMAALTVLLILGSSFALCKWVSGSSNVPLIEAMRQENLEGAHRMLRYGAHVNVRDNYGVTPLWFAIHQGYRELAEELLRAGADPKMSITGGDTTLMAAAWADDVETAELLLSRGVSVNATNVNGETALMMAIHTCWDGARGHNLEVIGNPSNNLSGQSRQARFENCREGKTIRVLLDAGADPNKKATSGFSALLGAAMEGNVVFVEELLRAGADPRVKSDGNTTPESASCDRGAERYFRTCALIREALK